MEKGGRRGQITGLARDIACGTRRATVMHGTRECDVGAHPIWTETAVHCTNEQAAEGSGVTVCDGRASAARMPVGPERTRDGAECVGVVVRQSSGQCGAGREAVMQIQVLAG